MNRLALATALLFAAAVPLSAQSVAGSWEATMGTPGGASSFKLVLRTKGDTLSGTVYRTAGEVPLTGTVKGDSLHFSYLIVYGEQPFPITVHVKVKGDAMNGIADLNGKADAPFSARRQPAVKSE